MSRRLSWAMLRSANHPPNHTGNSMRQVNRIGYKCSERDFADKSDRDSHPLPHRHVQHHPQLKSYACPYAQRTILSKPSSMRLDRTSAVPQGDSGQVRERHSDLDSDRIVLVHTGHASRRTCGVLTWRCVSDASRESLLSRKIPAPSTLYPIRLTALMLLPVWVEVEWLAD